MPFLPPNQQCRSTEGKPYDIAPKLKPNQGRITPRSPHGAPCCLMLLLRSDDGQRARREAMTQFAAAVFGCDRRPAPGDQRAGGRAGMDSRRLLQRKADRSLPAGAACPDSGPDSLDTADIMTSSATARLALIRRR